MQSKLIKNAFVGLTAICAVAGFVPSASAAAPTGTCGLIASIPHPETDWYGYMGGVSAAMPLTKNMDLLAEINFTTKIIYYSITQFQWTGTPPLLKNTIAGSVPFILNPPVANPTNSTPNSYQIVFTAGGSAVTLNVLPVNS